MLRVKQIELPSYIYKNWNIASPDSKEKHRCNQDFQEKLFEVVLNPVTGGRICSFLQFPDLVNFTHVNSRCFYLGTKPECFEMYKNRYEEKIKFYNQKIKEGLDNYQEGSLGVHLPYLADGVLREIAMFSNPSPEVRVLLSLLICLLFDQPYPKQQKSYLRFLKDKSLITRFRSFDPDNVSKRNRIYLKKYFVGKFNPQVLRRKSMASAELYDWFQAICDYLAFKKYKGGFDVEKYHRLKLQLAKRLVLIEKKSNYTWSVPVSDDQEDSFDQNELDHEEDVNEDLKQNPLEELNRSHDYIVI